MSAASDGAVYLPKQGIQCRLLNFNELSGDFSGVGILRRQFCLYNGCEMRGEIQRPIQWSGHSPSGQNPCDRIPLANGAGRLLSINLVDQCPQDESFLWIIGGFGSNECSVHMDEASSATNGECGLLLPPPLAPLLLLLLLLLLLVDRPLTRHLLSTVLGIGPPPALSQHSELFQERWRGDIQPGTLITQAMQRSAGAP